MKESQAPEPTPAVTGSARHGAAPAGHRIEHLVVGLVSLAALGVGVTNYSPLWGFWYWAAMIPIFGFAAGYSSWARVRARGETVTGLLRRQTLHWLGLLAAVALVYLLTQTGRMASQDAGLVALLCLALTTFLAGIHADWRISLVGGMLGGVVLALAVVEQFLWVVLFLAAIALLQLGWGWRRSARGKVQ